MKHELSRVTELQLQDVTFPLAQHDGVGEFIPSKAGSSPEDIEKMPMNMKGIHQIKLEQIDQVDSHPFLELHLNGRTLKVEAHGQREDKAKTMDITLYHQDAYMFTAIPVAACLLQYLDGSIRKTGLWTQANIVEPNRLMQDMERMGVHIQIQEKTGNGT